MHLPAPLLSIPHFVLSFAALLAPSALAIPAPTTEKSELPAAAAAANPELPLASTGPEPGNVTLCTNPDFTGTCATFAAGIGEPGTCFLLPGPYRANVGSVGPDRGAICRLFDNNKCQGSGYFIG